ncbi:hypothetical protein HMPREF0762_00196 [Slackia exigua ATCC 700122]|uniref:Uncharacterized protein n=1 Tax=Slackia exigua (strain ATCC 700122 / DSM 15923 / CIP 105133 / JCM 11022 / KCTC 5966 / S-7) TaxID=649764 RepID=D0WEG6_SLAES|nr:hypothetical protein HMPREF0762_00196 [Slackia exigua ATCC 700122]
MLCTHRRACDLHSCERMRAFLHGDGPVFRTACKKAIISPHDA